MTRQQEFRKQTEEAKFEAFSLMCKKVADLENKIADIKANCDLAIEGRDIKIKELEQENKRLKSLIQEGHKIGNDEFWISVWTYVRENKRLKEQIEKMKCCSNCGHFNKEEDIEHCWNCERQLVNSLDNLTREEIIKDEWEIKENV